MGPVEDDFMARCMIEVKDCAYSTGNDVPKPKWHACHLRPGAPPCGEILVSFSIVEDDYNFKVPLNYMNIKEEVDFKEYNVNINVLGLRDL